MSENQETKEEPKQETNENNLSNEEIKNMIKSWVEADEKIDALNKALKDLKDEKKQYENFIIDYMEENHNIEVSSGGSRIKKAVQKTRAGFNEKVIIVGLTEITKGDESKAKDITKIISQKREMKEKTYLKKAKKP
jgi:hypothetical protein